MHDEAPQGSNPADNSAIGDSIEARHSRRSFRGGGAASVAVVAGGTSLAGFLASCAPAPPPGGGTTTVPPTPSLLGFTSVAPSAADAIVVAPGYTAEVLIPWGQPLRSDGPAWMKDGSNTAEEQAQQIGMHHDGMSFFPDNGLHGSHRGLLVLNHEYVDTVLLYPDGVVEARSPEGEEFGVERLMDLLVRESASGLLASEVLRRLVVGCLDFQGGRLRDDATLLLVEWAGPRALVVAQRQG